MLQSELPRINLKWATHTKFTPQASKGSLLKWFCRDVGKLILGWNMAQNYGSLLNIISQ
jgi:hypothetical protein